MKLYYSPGACSLSPHIVLKESGLAFEAIAAPTKTHKLADGTDDDTIGTEPHKGFSPLLAPGMRAEAKEMIKTRPFSRLNWVDAELAGKNYLMGDTLTVTDANLFVVADWGKHVDVESLAWPSEGL